MSWFDLLPLLSVMLSYYLGYLSGRRYAKDELDVATQNASQWAKVARDRRIAHEAFMSLIQQAHEAARLQHPKPPTGGGDEAPSRQEPMPLQAP